MLCFWLATLKGKLNHIHRCRLRCHRFRSFFGKKKYEKSKQAASKKTKAATTGGWTSKSRTELCYSRYMTINNAIATRDLPTHGWKNINSAGAKPHGLVGSEVIRLQAARVISLQTFVYWTTFPTSPRIWTRPPKCTVVSFKVQTTAAASPSFATHSNWTKIFLLVFFF